MNRTLNVVVGTLAMNFVLVVGGVAWLYRSGHLDRQKAQAIREMLFAPPPPVEGEATLTTQPSPTTQPSLRLDELLAKSSGLSPGRQVEIIQESFDAQVALLDRRQQELAALQRQVDLAKQQLERDRTALTSQQQQLTAQQQAAVQLAGDKGFQDSLQLYQSLSGKQVKTIFMSLDDATVMSYLQAMEPRAAARIIKEFKSPAEVQRIQRVLERMRQAEPTPQLQSNEPAGPVPQASNQGWN
jgi:hypothetical protein